MPQALRLLSIGAGCLLMLVAAQPDRTWASPPPHAPAHGWRAKHDPNYAGYTGRDWHDDYGILDGRCNRQAIGGALGGAVGGVVGNQVDGGNRTVAILAGTVLGAVIGSEIGRRMDNADQTCIAHGLELAPDGQTVSWDAPERDLRYSMTPRSRHGDNDCRRFTLRVDGAYDETIDAIGCPRGDGTWALERN